MNVSRLMLLSILAYAAAQVIAPFSYTFPLQAESFGVLLAFLSALVGGAYVQEVLSIRHQGRPATQFDEASVRRVASFVTLVATVGMALRLVDLFVLRSEQFGGGQDARLVQIKLAAGSAGTGAGGFSAVSAVLSSFTLFGLVFYRHFRDWLPRWLSRYMLAMGFFAAFEALASRGGVFALGYVGVFSWFVLGDDRKLRAGSFMQRMGIPIVLSLGVGFVLIGGYLFRQRIKFMYGSVANYQIALAGTSLLRFSDWAIELSRSGFVGALVFPFMWITDYTLQGLAELNYLLNTFDERTRTYGAFQFDVFVRGFNLLLGRTHENVEILNPRAGKYATFLADVFIDFGVLGGAVQMFILGFIASAAHASRATIGPWGIVFGPLLKSMLMVGFLLNVLPGARSYTLVSGFFVVILLGLCTAKQGANRFAAVRGEAARA